MAYDNDNIFAKILRGEIPCNKVYEDEFALAFRDIAPQAKVHTLVIPKGAYVSFDDFSTQATDAEIIGFVRRCRRPQRSKAWLIGLPPARQPRRRWRSGSAAFPRPHRRW